MAGCTISGRYVVSQSAVERVQRMTAAEAEGMIVPAQRSDDKDPVRLEAKVLRRAQVVRVDGTDLVVLAKVLDPRRSAAAAMMIGGGLLLAVSVPLGVVLASTAADSCGGCVAGRWTPIPATGVAVAITLLLGGGYLLATSGYERLEGPASRPGHRPLVSKGPPSPRLTLRGLEF